MFVKEKSLVFSNLCDISILEKEDEEKKDFKELLKNFKKWLHISILNLELEYIYVSLNIF